MHSNELVSNEANVEALYDVGRSTKVYSPDRMREKGIGVKIDFRFSDTPHVSSNNFGSASHRIDVLRACVVCATLQLAQGN